MKNKLLWLFGLLFYTFFYSNLYSQISGTSIDQNSNSFEWIKYGDQYWSVVNAEVETYRDGTPIPYIEDQTVWKDLTIGAWCYYENDSTDDKIHGKLYNWYAVAGIFDDASLNDASLRKEFAPTGFRVPNNDDWNEFYQYMISDGYNFDNSNDGNKLAKSLASVQLWNSSDVDGSPGQSKESNNSSQFNAIPVGVRGGCCFTDYFYSRGIQTYFWSKNEHDQNHSICTYINFEDNKSNFQNNFKTDGYSVRFVSSEKPVYNSNILLNGSVSAENNQIKNVADPTDAQDAVTKSYVENLLKEYQSQINNLQEQIDALQAVNNSGTVTDQDDNSYPYLTYGDQVWTVKNAEMVTYRDGTPIPQVTDATEWANLTTGAWCYYDNDPSKGKLYNWYAVAGIHDNDENNPNKELAPEGWHVPSDAEWTELENHLIANGYNYDGTTTGNKIAKAMSSTTGWDGSDGEGVTGNNQILNNSSGFNAFSVGLRDDNGFFEREGINAIIWSSTEISNSLALYSYLRNNDSRLLIYGTSGFPNSKNYGFSVRFVRD